jgi:type IV secretion system protein VirD4
MIPNVATAVLSKPIKTAPQTSRALKAVVLAAASLLATAYLASFLFLCSIHADPRRATPLTLLRYAYYYGDRLDVRHRLVGASGVVFFTVLLTLGALLLPRRPHSSTWSHPAAVWQKPVRPATRAGLVVKGVSVSVAALLASAYLAGFLFLSLIHADPRRATPLTLLQYDYYYGDRLEMRRRLVGASGLALAAVLSSVGAALLPRRRPLHGDARFATRSEICRAGLFGSQGIILGRIGRRPLMLGGQQGVALAAPPRAGKGTSLVIPNALTWPGSFVCLDMKRENWNVTAGYRERCGQACYLFDPFSDDGRTARWNPFHYVSGEPARRVNDLQRIAEMLYPDPPNVDPFWMASARSLFLGIALYLFESPTLTKTMGEVLRQGMASDAEGFGHHWKRIIEGRQSGDYPLSPECVRALYDVIDLAPVTASSIRKTFTSRLDLWLNPILDAATSANDFDLRDLRKKPMSIYVGVNPNDLHRLRPVLSLLFQQALGLQTRELPERNPALKYQVLMMLDETTAPGRIPIIAESISYLPGYNVRVVIIIQTPSQLREVYGIYNTDTMLKSLAARVLFTPKDFNDAKEISDELGYTTVKVKTVSKGGTSPFQSRGGRSRTQNVSEQRRALLLPQEVKELGSEEAIILYEGVRPIRCQKIRYYADRRFRARLLPPPSKPAPNWVAAALRAANAPRAVPAPFQAPISPMGATRDERAAAPTATRLRDSTVEDVEGRITSLALEDYERDFSGVAFPDREGRLASRELTTALVHFLECSASKRSAS